MQNAAFIYQGMDPEALYQERSKSVIKRRDEIIKKKMNETQNKIEAKNYKYEQFKHTRNGNNNISNVSLNKHSNNQKS